MAIFMLFVLLTEQKYPYMRCFVVMSMNIFSVVLFYWYEKIQLYIIAIIVDIKIDRITLLSKLAGLSNLTQGNCFVLVA